MVSVSVIIPNYNHGKYLEQRVQSVLNQSYQNFEIILLDDFSSDNSREILEKYRNHSKISEIIYNEKNSGSTFIQWQKGIEIAKGEYIWIAESDDSSDCDFLNNAIISLSPNEVSLFFCNSIYIDSVGKFIGNSSFFECPDKILSGKDFAENYLITGNSIINASACVFKKSVIETSWWESIVQYKYCGDWLFWSFICTKGFVYNSSKYLNSFRKHENNVSGSAEKNGLFFVEGIKVIEQIEINFEYRLTYAQLNHWANKLANFVYTLGINKSIIVLYTILQQKTKPALYILVNTLGVYCKHYLFKKIRISKS